MGVKVKAWKGAWWIFVDHHGRKAKRVGTGKESQKAAAAAAEKIQARLVLGDLALLEEPDPREVTLKEFAEQWLATDVALRLKPGTVEKYREVLRNHWLPELGRLPLSVSKRDHVKTILQGKLMGGRGSANGEPCGPCGEFYRTVTRRRSGLRAVCGGQR
jgi:hypothetical protein